MTQFSNFRLRSLSGRVFWAFMVLATLMLITGIGAFVLVNQTDNAYRAQLDLTKQAASAHQFATLSADQDNTINQIQINGLAVDLAYFQTALTQLQTSLAQANGNQAAESFQNLKSLTTSLSNVLTKSDNQTGNTQTNILFFNELKDAFDKLNIEAQTFDRERATGQTQATQNYNNLVATVRELYLVGAIILFCLGLLLAIELTRTVAWPLVRLARGLNRVAAGDLTEQLEISGAEELANLSITFNRTMANLKLAIVRIQTQAEVIGQITGHIIEASNQQAQRLSEQAIAVTDVSKTVAGLSKTNQQIATSARQVAERVDQAMLRASKGYDTMLVARDTMSEMQEKIGLIYERIQDLNSVAQHIRQITLLIDTLSNDTHLLALNASIESVGMEEGDERFTTVASQVRRLSQRSRAAAVEIQQLVNQTQQSANQSVNVTKQGIEVVDRGERMVAESLVTTENIINQINQTTQLTQAISQATEQQREASVQVSYTLQHLSQFITNLSANSQQFLLSANDLGQVVKELNNIIQAFTVTVADDPTSDPPNQRQPTPERDTGGLIFGSNL